MLRIRCCKEGFHAQSSDVKMTVEVQKKAKDFKCEWYDAFISKLKRKGWKGPTELYGEVTVDQTKQNDQPLHQNVDS